MTSVTAATKYTPGPWFVKPARTRLHIRNAADPRFGATGRYIGELARACGSAECAANAALIAAAPDLLAALRSVVGNDNDNDGSLGVSAGVGKRNWQATMKQVRRAVAKAEGAAQ